MVGTNKDRANDVVMTLPEKLEALHLYGINLDKGTIFISGNIEDSLCIILRIKYDMILEYWRASFQKKPQEISIVFNSIGGDASAIMSIMDFYDELKKDGVLVNAHVEGNCMSAATFIVAAASGKRSATKRCRFMVHEIQLAGVEGTRTQVKSFQDEIEFLQHKCYEDYAQLCLRNTKKKINKTLLQAETKKWEQLCEKETYFGSEKALELGMIDEII